MIYLPLYNAHFCTEFLSARAEDYFIIKLAKQSEFQYKWKYLAVWKLVIYLFNTVSSLQVWIITCTNCSHGSRFIARVRLGRVFKVWIRTSRTVHTDVPCHINVRATMWFTHDGNDSNLKSIKYNLRTRLRVIQSANLSSYGKTLYELFIDAKFCPGKHEFSDISEDLICVFIK